MGVMRKLGRVAGRAAASAVPQVGRKVARVARKVGPTPQELVAAGEKVVDNLRTRNPELMAKVSSAAAKVVGKAGEYLPGVVERATRMVDGAHGVPGATGAAQRTGQASSAGTRPDGGPARSAGRDGTGGGSGPTAR